MPENDWGRPGPAEHPAYYYLSCPECEGEFPPDSEHFAGDYCPDWADGAGLSDPYEFMPEGWLSPTPELEQEMTEFYERLLHKDRLEDC